MIFSFTPWLIIIPTHVDTNQCTCQGVISRALRHAPAATKKGVADLCLYQLQCMYITVLRFSRYVASYNIIKWRARAVKSMRIIKWTHWHSSIFTRQSFPNPDSSKFSTVKILRHTVTIMYSCYCHTLKMVTIGQCKYVSQFVQTCTITL